MSTDRNSCDKSTSQPLRGHVTQIDPKQEISAGKEDVKGEQHSTTQSSSSGLNGHVTEASITTSQILHGTDAQPPSKTGETSAPKKMEENVSGLNTKVLGLNTEVQGHDLTSGTSVPKQVGPEGGTMLPLASDARAPAKSVVENTPSVHKTEHSKASSKLALKEFEPLSDLLSHIPQKVQRGLKTNYEPLDLTALDANQYFIALGSNIGTVFLFDRVKQEMQRLKSEMSSDTVTCVSLHHGLDNLVAVGYSSGTICIYQLPNEMIGHSKQLERFKVSDVHQDSLTCLAWSTNGMKLFSGDSKGCVGCTEVDFYEGKSQSSALLIESNTEIIQLHHGHRALIVATKHRCFIIQMNRQQEPTQIGSKDRKILGDFGACFIPAMCKPEDAQLYAARPGFRIWKASINGTVLQTYMFKELIAQHQAEMPLLDFKVTNITKSFTTNQFGPLHLFRDKLLVSWDDTCLYVINPEDTSIVGIQKHIGRIKAAAVCDEEIFVLRMGTDRNLVRISDRPVTRPTSQLLRQLEAERQFKKEHPSIVKEELTSQKKESKEVKMPKKEDNREPKSKPDISPFKAFGGNFLDKVKHIGNPVAFIDKVQEKLHSEKRVEMEHVHLVEIPEAGVNPEVSPAAELPPVVQLNSPGLLPLEIKPVSVDSVQQSMPQIQISSKQTDDRKFVTQSDSRQTGSGAQSALNRLQEDHRAEETSSPVYRIATLPQVKVPQDAAHEGEESIVFSRKVKRKKKGAKDRTSKRLEAGGRDSDTISVNSTTSVDSSENVLVTTHSSEGSSLLRNEHDHPDNDRLQSETDQHLAKPQLSGPQDLALSSSSSISSEAATSQNLHSGVVDHQITKSHISESQDIALYSSSSIISEPVGSQNMHSGVADHQITKPQISESQDITLGSSSSIISEPVGSQNMLSKAVSGNILHFTASQSGSLPCDASDSLHFSVSATKTEQLTDRSLTDDTSEQCQNTCLENVCDKLSDTRVSDEGANKTFSENTSVLQTNVVSEDEYKPSLSVEHKDSLEGDKEVFRKSIDGSESIKSLNDEHDNLGGYHFEYRSEAEQRLYRSIIGVERHDSREQEILKSFTEEDTDYVPSNLEKELNTLELSTIENEMAAAAAKETTASSTNEVSSSFKKSGPPSIYTIYSKPGATAEDFYSRYTPNSPTDASPSDFYSEENVARKFETVDDPAMSNEVTENSDFLLSLNRWIEVTAQGNIYSISVTNTHVWITDRSWNIFYSPLTNFIATWKKANGQASQISVSPDGSIVWCLVKNTVNVGTKITAKRPEGLKWVEVARDVAYISVDDTCAWYIKTNQQVMIQKGLSKERPFYTSHEVECKHRLKQIVCHSGVVWALTDKCQWLYRTGVTDTCPEGKDWQCGDRSDENHLFSHLALGDGNHGWGLDIVGQVWFCSGVTMATPRGDKQWWQVPLSVEYVVKDMTALEMLKSFTQKFDPQKLTMLLSTQNGGLIAACSGVWVCQEYKHTLQVCRESIEGHIWQEAFPLSLSSSSVWKTVVASNASNTNGVVWAQQPNGDIFAFTQDRENCSSIPGPPKRGTCALFVCICACTDALWGLTDEGEVYIREGMSELEPRGNSWHKLDLSQLDDRQLVHLSCSSESIWSVDSDGMVWHRIGVKAPSDRTLNAAWLPVDNGDTVFTQVVAGRQDWMVWAVDNRRQVYVRSGITAEMPIGRKWIHVSGSFVMQISLSDNYVFALNHAGELLYRHGVVKDHITGEYWRKLPGELAVISATPKNNLWGINKEGQLVRRHTKYIVKASFKSDPPLSGTSQTSSRDRKRAQSSVSSEDGDWEIV